MFTTASSSSLAYSPWKLAKYLDMNVTNKWWGLDKYRPVIIDTHFICTCALMWKCAVRRLLWA